MEPKEIAEMIFDLAEGIDVDPMDLYEAIVAGNIFAGSNERKRVLKEIEKLTDN